MSDQVKILKIRVINEQSRLPEIHIYVALDVFKYLGGLNHEFSTQLFMEKEKHWVVIRYCDDLPDYGMMTI